MKFHLEDQQKINQLQSSNMSRLSTTYYARICCSTFLLGQSISGNKHHPMHLLFFILFRLSFVATEPTFPRIITPHDDKSVRNLVLKTTEVNMNPQRLRPFTSSASNSYFELLCLNVWHLFANCINELHVPLNWHSKLGHPIPTWLLPRANLLIVEAMNYLSPRSISFHVMATNNLSV